MQNHFSWINDILGIGHFLVMRFSWVSSAEERHSLGFDRRNHQVFVAMGFLLAAVVQRLFFSLFWSLTTPFRAIDDRIRHILAVLLMFLEFLRVSFGLVPKRVQRLAQDGQENMDPLVGLRLPDAKQFAHDRLQRIAFLIHQGKQQFLFDGG